MWSCFSSFSFSVDSNGPTHRKKDLGVVYGRQCRTEKIPQVAFLQYILTFLLHYLLCLYMYIWAYICAASASSPQDVGLKRCKSLSRVVVAQCKVGGGTKDVKISYLHDLRSLRCRLWLFSFARLVFIWPSSLPLMQAQHADCVSHPGKQPLIKLVKLETDIKYLIISWGDIHGEEKEKSFCPF